MYVKENLNPQNKNVGDCVIRAISKVLNQSWGRTYIELAVYGYTMADLQSADSVWDQYLLDKGFTKALLPINCPNCMTVREFADIYSKGRFLLFVGEHVQFISRQYNLPQNVGNNPQQIVQYLLDSGQINQQMVNKAQGMLPQLNQIFGKK